jgi:hypothetical protein
MAFQSSIPNSYKSIEKVKYYTEIIYDNTVLHQLIGLSQQQIQVPASIPRVGAKNVLRLTVQVRIVKAGSGGSVQAV